MKNSDFIYQPPSDPLEIIHQDNDILVVNKPAGLLSVPGKAAEHQDCFEHRIKALLPEALLIHRLDMDTSGLMIFAMNKPAQRHLGLQFEKRYVSKTYVALVHGIISEKSGQINLPLIVDWPNRPLQMVCYERGKSATTDWVTLGVEGNTTRVELHPLTGRSHQLRVHMLELGHPILGDRFYGPPDANQRMMLHSQTLTIRHPNGGQSITFHKDANF